MKMRCKIYCPDSLREAARSVASLLDDRVECFSTLSDQERREVVAVFLSHIAITDERMDTHRAQFTKMFSIENTFKIAIMVFLKEYAVIDTIVEELRTDPEIEALLFEFKKEIDGIGRLENILISRRLTSITATILRPG